MLHTRPFHLWFFAASGTPAESAEEPEVVETPEAETPEAVESSEAVDAVEAPEPPDFSEYMKSHGLEFDSPDTLRSQLESAKQAQTERDTYRNQALYLMHAQQQAEQARQQQMQAWQQQQQPQKPKLPWEIPEFDSRAIQFLSKDADGNLVVAPGGDPTLPAKYQAWSRAREDALNQLLTKPEVLMEYFAPQVQQQAYQIAMHVAQQQAERQMLEQQNREHAAWAVQNGQLTDLGQEWNNTYGNLRQRGIDHETASKLAHAQVDSVVLARKLASEQQTPAETPAQANAKKKADFLRNGTARKPNRGGTLPSRTRETHPQNGKDFEAMMKRGFADIPPEDFEL